VTLSYALAFSQDFSGAMAPRNTRHGASAAKRRASERRSPSSASARPRAGGGARFAAPAFVSGLLGRVRQLVPGRKPSGSGGARGSSSRSC